MNNAISPVFIKRHPKFFKQQDNRRVGEIHYTPEFLIDAKDIDIVRRIFSKIFPIDIRYDEQRDVFVMVGISKEFDILEKGKKIPRYRGIIKKTLRKGKPVYFITFKKD